ncbi:Ig-like domain-containing protein [Marinobacter sp. HL-58]|uniref:Ig-like domain-containing protein n=1 Tax=Marinobacter sp. HL-58 TaxID=1479237 RepID=UPI0004897B51|nr:Ig-like domain-containing protein [Marinobacter sp. HL-58]
MDGDESTGNDGGNGDNGSEQEIFCSSGDTTFEVAEFVPENGSQNVEPNRSIRLTFNAEIDEESVSQNSLPLTIDGDATMVASSYSVLGKTVVINPDEDLNANTDYVVTATTELRALCDSEGDLVKSLVDNDSAEFTTGEEIDDQGPEVVSASPDDGETLAPVDSSVFVEFDEEIDPQSVDENNFTVSELDENGDVVSSVDGEINPVGNSIEFVPSADLKGQTFYEIAVDTSITDLAGNPLVEQEQFTFRSGGLVVLLNDSVVSQLGPLDEALNTLGGTLLEPLAFGNEDDGLDSLDNALLLQIPLLTGLTDQLSGVGDIGDSDFSTTNINGTEFAEFSSALVAVCDPKTVTPSPDCTVALDLDLDPDQLQSLADTFTEGNPEQIPALIEALGESLATGDFNNLPPELSDVLGNELSESEGVIELRLVDDSGTPLPEPAEEGLQTVLDGLNAIPVLGDLVAQDDGASLVDLGLLEGSLLGVDLGELATADVLSGTEQIIGDQGVLNLGGSLFDLLLERIPEPGQGAPGGDLPLSPEDLPLIGDLLNMEGGSPLDPNQLGELSELLMLPDDFEFEPETVPLVGDILSALPSDFPGEFPDGGADQLPLIGDLVMLLDPSNLGDADGGDPLTSAPLLGDLVEQLLAFSDGGGEADPGSLPLIDDFARLLDDEALSGDSPLAPLTDVLNPDQLRDVTLVGGLVDLLNPEN